MFQRIRDSVVMVFSPHADDELLGCGGTLLRLRAEGASVVLVLVCCSDCYFHHQHGTVSGDVLRREFMLSAGELGAKPSVLGFPYAELDTVPRRQVVHEMDLLIAEWKPDTLFVPEPGTHQDHQAVYAAAQAALRPSRRCLPNAVYLYEVPTSATGQEFTPNVWVDVTETMKEKLRIFGSVYRSQCTAHGNEETKRSLRDVEARATFRGIEGGYQYAEAFQLLREAR